MNKSEIFDLMLVTIVLGFCFSFRNWGSGSNFWQTGLVNLLITSGVVFISILMHEVLHKAVGKKYAVDVKTKTWKTSLFLAILSTILTNGYFVFAAVWSIILNGKKIYTYGKKYSFPGPRQRAKIALIGPVSNFLLGVIGYALFLKTGNFIAKQIAYINFYIAVFNLFPFFRVLYLWINAPMMKLKKYGKVSENYWMKYIDRTLLNFQKSSAKNEEIAFNEGEMVFFGSRPFWFFFFPLILLSEIFIILTNNILLSLFLGFLISAGVWLSEQHLVEEKVKYEG